jgi:hypothetical protein
VEKFTPMEAFSASIMGAIIYVFGGDYLMQTSYNNLLYFSTGVPCPNDCSGSNGVCRNHRCNCEGSHYGNSLLF